jgi:ribosomal protein S6
MNFNAPADVPAELNRLMRISEDVVRHQIIKQEEIPADAPKVAEVAAEA